jgi:hypothetical protein
MENLDHRKLAVSLFNQTWELISKTDRTPADDISMVTKAHTSLFHWLQVGSALNEARGLWQISRVYSILKWAEPALVHGGRCLQICLDQKIGDFDLFFAYEAVARAQGVAGNKSEKERNIELAKKAIEGIQKQGDKDYAVTELSSIR